MAIIGQITINQITVLEVDAPPADGGGTPAPLGSIASYNDGSNSTLYIKRLPSNTGWDLFTQQAGALTSTRLPFTNSSGLLTDSANLNWDNINSRLGINLSTLSRTLHVSTITSSAEDGIFVDAYGVNPGAISIRKANGTPEAPTAVTSNQVLGKFGVFGYGASVFSANQIGSIALIAAENFTDTDNGTHIAFYTTPIGSSSESEVLRITESGNIGLGTTTPNQSAKLEINSTTQGFLMPRMTSIQRAAISSPATGLTIYETTSNLFFYFNGDQWTSISPISSISPTGQFLVGVEPAIVTLTDAPVITTDVTNGNIFTVTLTGDRTLGAPTGMGLTRQRITFVISQDSIGNRTLTFNPVFNFGMDLIGMSLSTAPNSTDYIGCVYNPITLKWDVVAFLRGY